MFYAEFNVRLFFFLIFSKKDILLSNDLDTLLPNYLVSIFQKKKLVYDSHELFPEIPELVHKPFVKKCWSKLESFILPKIKNNYTVCNSIASYYSKKYDTNFKTIRNLPRTKKIETGILPFKKGKTSNGWVIFYKSTFKFFRDYILKLGFLDGYHGYVVCKNSAYAKYLKYAKLRDLNNSV